MSRFLWLCGLVVLVVWCTSACASTTSNRESTVRSYPVVGAQAAGHIQGISTDNVALATIADQFRRAYAFPDVAASIHVLSGRPAFEAALLDAGYDAAFARDTSTTMRAVALHRRVLVNGAAMRSLSWTARVGTLAHELVHILQYDIAGGRRGIRAMVARRLRGVGVGRRAPAPWGVGARSRHATLRG